MIEFIDETAERQGTLLNRENLMGMQGFMNQTVTFTSDGRIIERNTVNGETKTTFINADGSITETFVGEKTISKTTRFNSDGSITEVIS